MSYSISKSERLKYYKNRLREWEYEETERYFEDGGIFDPVISLPSLFFCFSYIVLVIVFFNTNIILTIVCISIDILLWVNLYYYILKTYLVPRAQRDNEYKTIKNEILSKIDELSP